MLKLEKEIHWNREKSIERKRKERVSCWNQIIKVQLFLHSLFVVFEELNYKS